VDGDVSLRIPPGTQPGKVFRLREKGVTAIRKATRGDQLVTVNVNIPTTLDTNQKELLEALGKSMGTDIKLRERSFFDKLKDKLGG
jgi:molecular chaperone DnaJ